MTAIIESLLVRPQKAKGLYSRTRLFTPLPPGLCVNVWASVDFLWWWQTCFVRFIITVIYGVLPKPPRLLLQLTTSDAAGTEVPVAQLYQWLHDGQLATQAIDLDVDLDLGFPRCLQCELVATLLSRRPPTTHDCRRGQSIVLVVPH